MNPKARKPGFIFSPFTRWLYLLPQVKVLTFGGFCCQLVWFCSPEAGTSALSIPSRCSIELQPGPSKGYLRTKLVHIAEMHQALDSSKTKLIWRPALCRICLNLFSVARIDCPSLDNSIHKEKKIILLHDLGD